MKNKVVGLLLSGVLMFSMVGCSNYKIKDEYYYNYGYEQLEKLTTEVYETYYDKIYEELEDEATFIARELTEKIKMWSIKDENGNEPNREEEEEARKDVQFGYIDHMLDRLKKEKKQGLIGYYENGLEIELGDDVIKILNKYEDEYKDIICEYIELFREIRREYTGDLMSEEYRDKVKEINKKREELFKTIGKDLLINTNIIKNIFINAISE